MNMILETERLVLRVLNDSFYMQVLTFLSRNRELFDQFEVEKPLNFYTADFQKRSLYQEYAQILNRTRIRYFIFLKENPQRIIGTVSFTDFRSSFHSCRIGYKFDPNFHGYGYACETLLEALMQVTKDYDLHRIEAHVLPSNQPSIKLLTRLGFELEGTARAYAFLDGKWEDHLQYSLICDC